MKFDEAVNSFFQIQNKVPHDSKTEIVVPAFSEDVHKNVGIFLAVFDTPLPHVGIFIPIYLTSTL